MVPRFEIPYQFILEIFPHSSLSKLKIETTICPQLLMIAISFHT